MTPRRADAERNCEKILTVARDAFTCDEDVSMAEVARRAGVGMGTLYRNFANRQELLEALFTHEVDIVCQAAEATELSAWLHRLFGFFTDKRQWVAALLEDGGDCSDPVFGDSRARIIAAGQPLMTAAQQAGEVRDDLTVEQMLDMLCAIATIPAEPAYLDPIFAAALDGLKPR